ncbi:MAG: hypothetical protein JXA13_06335 [Anaerolineales bacterium]|nr:hypothetical protein [Anaerolineales bacterium]
MGNNSRYKPHIVIIIARGEALRNSLYSDMLKELEGQSKVSLLSVLNDFEFIDQYQHRVDQIIDLNEYREHQLVGYLRDVIDYAHYRWIWTKKVKNKWEILDAQAVTWDQKLRYTLWKALIFTLANRFTLEILTTIENKLSLWLKPTNDFDTLFEHIKPDLVFNTSHIHAPRGELPARVAHAMGIPTAAFVFSWDNLSSRGRILPKYDHFLVWHTQMREQLLRLYPGVQSNQVHITGTPQFDYHFKPEFCLSRQELCDQLGLDSSRPFILYTTGMAHDFPEEVYHVETVINILEEYPRSERPQLVVRTYIKGNSPEMEALAKKGIPDVVFPPVLWDEKWFTPRPDDLSIYSSLLHHCKLGINPASTVSLELMMLDKPVINLGFDPPGSNLPHYLRWKRHLEFDHYCNVVDSGAVMVAYSPDDLRRKIAESLEHPDKLEAARKEFINKTFGVTLDGKSAQRVAETLQLLASRKTPVRKI